MANNPVQIVLNAQSYIDYAFKPPGGGNKDFYADKDADFLVHKQLLLNQIGGLKNLLSNPQSGDLVYAKVELQSEAWAKSHRPTNKIFPSKKIVSVSASEIGSLIVEITPDDIPNIIENVEAAEEKTTWKKDKNNKEKPNPSRARSEVGAIKSIRNYDASDRRRFSLEQAVKWLSDPRTGCSYYVETFISHRSIENRSSNTNKERARRALIDFEGRLSLLNLPIEISRTSEKWTNSSLYIIKVGSRDNDENGRIENHRSLLEFLDNQVIVRSIFLPPILQTANIAGSQTDSPTISRTDTNKSYPVVGIIDSGVSNFPDISQWKAGSLDFLSPIGQDVSHGTFIAGLVCGSDELNSHEIFSEEKCQFYDLGLHPTSPGAYEKYYPRGFIDFLEQLDIEIPSALELGARIFNMSLAVTTPVMDNSYSLFANLLDEISDKHDIIFILPAGNLEEGLERDEWPESPNEAEDMLLNYRYPGLDRIYQPADSIRALVVGALNPPDSKNNLFPARYTRKGPGPSLGVKPDIAHVGGKFDKDSGLRSFSPDGNCIQSCGTSFAAPLAAKTMAVLDHIIEGGASRETLLALAIHHATVPECLTSKKLKTVKKDLVGFGIPSPSRETLLGADHEITLVFNGIIENGKELSFPFSWPQCLVGSNGQCSGKIRLTLVYRPPIDRNQGGEFVRINLDPFLRQEKIDEVTQKSSYVGRLKGDTSKHDERELLKHGAKWWPVKRQEAVVENAGNSSQWKLVIQPLARSGTALPEDGVPFTVILTIGDPSESEPVFNEMRRQLQTSGAVISDIRTTVRSRNRA